MGDERTEGAQQGESPKQYVTVGEAAKLLGVHRNTVHHRIKVGRITAHKVVEGEREVYRVELDSLGVGRPSADVRTLDAQRPIAGEEMGRMIAARLDEIVRDYAEQLGDLREELGSERAHRQIAEQRAADLEAKLEKLEARESPVSPGPTETPTPPPEEAQTAIQRPQGGTLRGWRRRILGW
jgi:excisionase family DNA binding protein